MESILIERHKIPTVLLEKYIAKNGGDLKEIIYELCFMQEEYGKNIDSVLENEKISFRHENFQDVAKKIDELDHFQDNPFESVKEGTEICKSCGSYRTITYSKNTRSSDEGATVFCKCVDCGHRAVYNS
jgi:DNA-directed RNA polymerase subunit M/transcription elongation factor TFIIS